jgi:hypothetical protein
VDRIPEPELLDAQQMLLTVSSASPGARRAVEAVCAYSRQLWIQLQDVREYLLDSTADGHARPSGRDDDEGWSRWTVAYADVTRLLTGTRGDGGFAATEAELEARRRRHPSQPPEVADRG